MTPGTHQISADQVRAIANGTGGGAELAILLRAQRSKTLTMLELVTRQAAAVRHPDAAAAASGRDLLARVQREAPDAADRLLRYPAIGAWAIETLLALGSSAPARARPGRLALIAGTAAIRGGLRARMEIPESECRDPGPHLPSLGSVTLPLGTRGGTAELRCQGGAAELSRGEVSVRIPQNLEAGSGWRPLTTVTTGPGPGTLRLILDDADPCRLPGYSGSLNPLTAPERAAWRHRIEGGWRLLALHHQGTAADIRSLIGTISPLGPADGGTRSATSRYAFGTAGLSLPDDDAAMALTLAHEVQHAKLCALMDMVPLVSSPPGPDRALHYAPWRPDPRPMASLLQGLYAYLGVTRFWLRQRDVADRPNEAHRASVEFDRWRRACALVTAAAGASPELTRCGAVFVGGMAGVLRSWRHERVSPEARAEARRAADEHWKRWGQNTENKGT